MDEGRPTGIKRQDVDSLAVVTFEGRRAQLYRKRQDERGRFLIELDPHEGGTRLALYGYFDGEEFMEVDRETID